MKSWNDPAKFKDYNAIYKALVRGIDDSAASIFETSLTTVAAFVTMMTSKLGIIALFGILAALQICATKKNKR